uniref:ERCC4 domain-containing protein n=1 Tax=Arcella intermedia TaxID=1963864 RepID=A0A6B2LBK0_9EUKA
MSNEKAPLKSTTQPKDTSKTKKRKKSGSGSGSDKEGKEDNHKNKKKKKNENGEGTTKEKQKTTTTKKKKMDSDEEELPKAKPKQDKVKKPRKKLRKTKEEAIQEMLVKIDLRLCEDCQGSQLVDMLKEKKCSVEVSELPVKGSIEWRRNTEEYRTSDFNSVEYVLLWLPGSEVTKLIMDNICLSEFITRLDEFYESSTKYIFLIENLSSWEKAAETIYQRNYRNEVLGIGKDKKNKLSKSDIEEAFIALQMDNHVQIVRTENQQETWAYICRLTYGKNLQYLSHFALKLQEENLQKHSQKPGCFN